MKPTNGKWELFEQLLQQRNQPEFRYLRRGRHNLPLRYFVDRVDVVNALAAVAIALMHRVDAQVTGPALRPRLAPFADWDDCRPRRMIAGVALAIGLGVAESVELRNG